MDPTGNQVILGYADGVVRLFALETESDTKSTGSSMYKLTKALSARYVLPLKILFKKAIRFLYQLLLQLGEYFFCSHRSLLQILAMHGSQDYRMYFEMYF